VPAYVAALETHRHHGFDIYVITQHPTLVEANVRRLVGTHRHIMRAFGSHAAIVHEWNEVRTDCDTKRDGSLSSTFRYPKEAFALYKSAEVHTHKARVPMRVWLVLASPLLLFAIGYGLYKWIAQRTDADAAASTVGKLAGVPSTGKGASAGGAAPARRGSGVDWFAVRSPRIADLPHTAPVYDEVTAPRRAPFPAMCIATSARCVCYTQDGTRLGTGADTCRRIAVDGFFKDWDENGGAERSPMRSGGGPPRFIADQQRRPRRNVSRRHVGRSPRSGWRGRPAPAYAVRPWYLHRAARSGPYGAV
jgi:hypothetical protein